MSKQKGGNDFEMQKKGLLHGASMFPENKQGWGQVTMTPKDQAASFQGKYRPV